MTWATLSVRKMILKNRINTLEAELLRVSQSLQTAYDNASYDQRVNQMAYDEKLAGLTDNYRTNMDNLSGTGEAYQKDYNDVTLNYMNGKKALDNLFNGQNQIIQDKSNAQTKALEAEQEQIETQLEVARAEYEQLDKACSQDIKDGAPDFGVG